jgi:hypothetical protein
MGFFWTILTLVASFLFACLIRKFGSHTLLNGFMSKEQADDVFPGWNKTKKDQQKHENTNNK